MRNDDHGEKLITVPAALVEQLQNMATRGSDAMQCAPGMPNPNPTPRPVSESTDTDD